MIFFSQECISVPHLSFRGKHFRLKHEEKESTNMMEFLTGVKEQETLELTTLLAGGRICHPAKKRRPDPVCI